MKGNIINTYGLSFDYVKTFFNDELINALINDIDLRQAAFDVVAQKKNSSFQEVKYTEYVGIIQ